MGAIEVMTEPSRRQTPKEDSRPHAPHSTNGHHPSFVDLIMQERSLHHGPRLHFRWGKRDVTLIETDQYNPEAPPSLWKELKHICEDLLSLLPHRGRK